MLKVYDPWEYTYHSFHWNEGGGVHMYASDLKEVLAFDEDDDDFETALQRALRVCETLAITVDDHFRSVYRYDRTALIHDWKLSNLACYLIIVNANPKNKHVARAQVYFAVKR